MTESERLQITKVIYLTLTLIMIASRLAGAILFVTSNSGEETMNIIKYMSLAINLGLAIWLIIERGMNPFLWIPVAIGMGFIFDWSYIALGFFGYSESRRQALGFSDPSEDIKPLV